MALICTKVSAVLHIDFVPPVQCQQCKCQYSKKGKKKKSFITIVKIILTSWIPWKGLESMGHTLRTSNYYDTASDGKQE